MLPLSLPHLPLIVLLLLMLLLVFSRSSVHRRVILEVLFVLDPPAAAADVRLERLPDAVAVRAQPLLPDPLARDATDLDGVPVDFVGRRLADAVRATAERVRQAGDLGYDEQLEEMAVLSSQPPVSREQCETDSTAMATQTRQGTGWWRGSEWVPQRTSVERYDIPE